MGSFIMMQGRVRCLDCDLYVGSGVTLKNYQQVMDNHRCGPRHSINPCFSWDAIDFDEYGNRGLHNGSIDISSINEPNDPLK